MVAAFPDNYVGVGLELTMRGDEPVIVRLLSGGSAAEAGVEIGDRLTAVNGVPTRGKTLGDVVMSLRGRPGTQVTMTLLRGASRHIVVVKRRGMHKGKAGYGAGGG